jgi:hypothetical protein
MGVAGVAEIKIQCGYLGSQPVCQCDRPDSGYSYGAAHGRPARRVAEINPSRPCRILEHRSHRWRIISCLIKERYLA